MPSMGRADGAIADRSTRRAVQRRVVAAAAVVLVGIGLTGFALANLVDAWSTRDQLESTGDAVAGLVISVSPRLAFDEVTYAFDGPDGRVRATATTSATYARGDDVEVRVDAADPTRSMLVGSIPEPPAGWPITALALVAGAVGLVLGVRRAVRATRALVIVRSHPWAAWTVQGIYPQRRRLAVTMDGDDEEHLVKLDRRAARRLAKLGRKSALYLAGSGRWFVVAPVGAVNHLAVARMDVPYQRFTLVDGARSAASDPYAPDPPA